MRMLFALLSLGLASQLFLLSTSGFSQDKPATADKKNIESKKEDKQAQSTEALRKFAELGPGIYAIKKDDKNRITSCIVVGHSDFSTLLGKAKGMKDARLRARHAALATFIQWLHSNIKIEGNKTASINESLLPNLEVLHAEVDEDFR